MTKIIIITKLSSEQSVGDVRITDWKRIPFNIYRSTTVVAPVLACHIVAVLIASLSLTSDH